MHASRRLVWTWRLWCGSRVICGGYRCPIELSHWIISRVATAEVQGIIEETIFSLKTAGHTTVCSLIWWIWTVGLIGWLMFSCMAPKPNLCWGKAFEFLPLTFSIVFFHWSILGLSLFFGWSGSWMATHSRPKIYQSIDRSINHSLITICTSNLQL